MEVALTFAASLSEANTLIAYTTIAAMVVVICYSRHRKPTLSNSIAAIVKAVRVPEAKIVGERMFPLTLSPSNQEAATQADRLAFVREHRIELLELVRTHGAVLLRGWGPCSSQHFAEVTKALGMTASEMSCSAGPRFEVAENVFTANEAPPSERIPFHHEMVRACMPTELEVCMYCDVEGMCSLLYAPRCAGPVRRPAVCGALLLRGGGFAWRGDADHPLASRGKISS